MTTAGSRSTESPLQVGSAAPDFELRDQNNQRWRLSSAIAGSNVLLVFFPLAFTGTCEGELGYLRDHEPEFSHDGLQTVAISVGPPPTHKVWSAAQGFLFPILADFWPHGAVARDYGVFNERSGFANRGTFLVDRTGQIRYADLVGPGEQRDERVWNAALAALPQG